MSELRLGETLVTVFDRVFRTTDDTILCGGATEPFYEPGSPSVIQQIMSKKITKFRYVALGRGVSRR